MIYRVSQSIQDQELEECNKKRTGQSQRVVKGATNGSRRLPCIDGPEELNRTGIVGEQVV